MQNERELILYRAQRTNVNICIKTMHTWTFLAVFLIDCLLLAYVYV